MNRTLLLCAQSLICAASPVLASEIRVPEQYPTIQDAVAAAMSGDEIVVTAGSHAGGLTIEGKALTIRSSGPVVTIDGGGGSGLVVNDVPAPGVRLIGLRVTGCVAGPLGAALRASNSVLEISECEFTGNRVSGGHGTHGGGAVYASTCAVRITSSNFRDNRVELSANGYPFGFGGAVMLDHCDALVEECVFSGNMVSTVVPDAAWAEARANGGAIAARWSSGVVSRCRFEANRVHSSVNGLGPLASAFGAALSLASPTGQRFIVDSCALTGNIAHTISNNSHYQGTGSANGAICFGIDGAAALHEVRSCDFEANRAEKSPETNGSAIADVACVFDSGAIVQDSRFAGSFASPLLKTLPGFGSWSGCVRAPVSAVAPGSSIARSTFCALECAVTGPEVSVSAMIESDACCEGDMDRSRTVDGADLGLLLAQWGVASIAEQADVNGDGIVDGADLATMLESWGPCPD